jgi:hypothetical protein
VGALVLASTCVGPLTLVCGFFVVALALFGERSSLVSVGMCVVVVASAPLVAGCAVSTLCKWCLPSASVRSIVSASGLLTVLALLSDGEALSGLVRVSSTAPSLTLLVRALSVASGAGILSASVVMLAVLILEVPARWFVSRDDGAEWEGILRTLRLIGTVGVLVAGWGIIDEFSRERITEYLSMFS